MGSAKPAFLYVIGSAEPGPHKVGISSAPNRRLRELQTGNPRRLMIKRTGPATITNAGTVENYAHWLLRESRACGEWFEVTEEAAWVALIAAEKAVAAGLNAPRIVASAGRPPLSRASATRPTMVRLTVDVRERIVALVGDKGMADFIRSAIESELKRRERTKPPKTP